MGSTVTNDGHQTVDEQRIDELQANAKRHL